MAAALAAGPALSGCAAKKDTRYLESREQSALAIPAGLDTPGYTQTMEIPRPGAARSAGADETGVDLELPPRRVLAAP